MPPDKETPKPKVLTSWKEIAEFLGVSVRTAQRYEEIGLPVRRLGSEKGRQVSAETVELDAWRKKAVVPKWWQDAHFLRRYALVCTAVALVLAFFVTRDVVASVMAGPPHHTVWLNATLIVSDRNGRELWRRAFEGGPSHWKSALGITYLGDLNNDGKAEVIVPYVGHNRDAEGGFLYCFSNTGRELWRIQPRRAVAVPHMKFSPVYVLRSFQVFRSPEKDGTQWVAATYAHHYEYPSVAVILDSGGKIRGEYWHSGHLDEVFVYDLDKDGRQEILFSGMDEGTSRAAIRVFDPRHVAGAAVLPPGHPKQLQGFQPGTELATVRFQRTRLNQAREHFNYAYWIGPGTSPLQSFQVFVRETIGESGAYLIYTIRPDLTLESVVPSASLRNDYLAHQCGDRRFQPFNDDDIADLKTGYEVERTEASGAGSASLGLK
jgi:hypothetical protein